MQVFKPQNDDVYIVCWPEFPHRQMANHASRATHNLLPAAAAYYNATEDQSVSQAGWQERTE
jgi:hypothetical protein